MTERILPAYPLFVKDPNFSLWGVSENLNESNVQSWWGAEKKIYGFIRTEGETYCFLGNGADFKNCGVQNARQTSLAVSSFSTDYEFTAGKVRLKVRFVSPLPLEDLLLLALPVCYMEYEIQGDEKAELSVFVNRHIAYNDTPSNQNTGVRGGVMELRGFESAFLGLKRQLPLSNNGDSIGADWGYYYLSGEQAYVLDERDLVAYLAGGFIVCPIGSEADKEPEAGKGADAAKETENGAVKGRPEFLNTGEERYMGSFNCARKGAVMLGYDDLVSIDYFGRFLKGYYLDKHTITEALEYVYHNRGAIDEKLAVFDQDLKKRAEQYGQAYYHILCGSLRQSISAHKLVKDTEGNVLFLSKEKFDKIWKLGLFPQSLLEREVDCYLQRLERYGVPLDSRADYTKSDWLMWAASLTDDTEKKKKLIRALDAFLKEAPERMPFGDWYGAKDGLCPSFRARSVVGGCFVLLL